MRMPLFGRRREAMEKELAEKRDQQVPALLQRIKDLQERDPQSEALAICEKRCAMLQDITNNHARATEKSQELRALLISINPTCLDRAEDLRLTTLMVAIDLIKELRQRVQEMEKTA